MIFLDKFAGQNWLITPAALAVGELPPTSIHDQKWLLTLSGVIFANLKGDTTKAWLHETVSFFPDMSGPLTWAINHFSIPKPPRDFDIDFSLEEWAPFVSLSSIFNEEVSTNSGFAVDVWRPAPFDTGTDALSHKPITQIFRGIEVDMAIRDNDAWIFRISYNITLLGKIVFPENIIFLKED